MVLKFSVLVNISMILPLKLASELIETFGPLESLRLMAVTASTDPKLVYHCRAIMRARITIAYHLTLFLWKDDYTNNKHIPVPTVEELNKKSMEILG